MTYMTIPSTISGGASIFQVRIGSGEVLSPGDEADFLIAFYQDSYENHLSALRKAKIITVSPSIEALPNYNTPIRGQYIRGRIVVCELPEDFEEQLPGTGVHVHLTEPGNFDIWDFGRTPIKAASN